MEKALTTQTTQPRPTRPAMSAKPGEHRYVAYGRQTLAKLGTERITRMGPDELFSWCSRLEVSLRRLMILIDGNAATPGRTTRDALVEFAELAIDNPEMDDQLLESIRNLTPNCAGVEHRRFHWGELKASVEQYDRGDLTVDGPEHWADKVEDALNELLGVRQ